jgi:hypothetical protein
MNILVRILRLKKKKLGDDEIGDMILYGVAQKNDPILE